MKSTDDLKSAERESVYLHTWRESLIPLCTNKSETSPHLCSEFIPSLTNRGMCFTKNLAPIKDIYHSSRYLENFHETFLSGRDIFPMLKNFGSGMRYKNSFLVDASRAMDLKNGLKWNKTKRAIFRIGVQNNFDMPEIHDTSIKVFAGYKTTIRVNAMQLESDEGINNVELAKRQCRFDYESDDLYLFKSYSR